MQGILGFQKQRFIFRGDPMTLNIWIEHKGVYQRIGNHICIKYKKSPGLINSVIDNK